MLKDTSAYLKSRGLTGPAMIIDEARARANIRAMAEKARASGVVFRPHFKTHQSPAVAKWFRDEGVEQITVSSVPMAELFAETGWNDITIAFLLNPLEAGRIERLADRMAARGGRLGVTVDSVAAAEAAANLKVAAGKDVDFRIDVWIKVDTGYGRTGIRWDAADDLERVLATAPRPAGLLTHPGHSYAARSRAQLLEIHARTVARLAAAADGRDLKLSVGDTPCCSVVDRFDGIDEIRPGNFVFYDLMQLETGSCTADQMAVAAVCPVVGIYPDRRQVVVHGGAVHLSRESLTSGERRIYGKLGVLDLPPGGQKAGLGVVIADAPVVSLSQEHGVLEMPSRLVRELEIGDLVVLWPVHSCLMSDLLGTSKHSQFSRFFIFQDPYMI